MPSQICLYLSYVCTSIYISIYIIISVSFSIYICSSFLLKIEDLLTCIHMEQWDLTCFRGASVFSSSPFL